MASFLQLAHHCFFLVSSTACCFSASVCFFTSATSRSRSCSRLCLISAIVSSACKSHKSHKIKDKRRNICVYTMLDNASPLARVLTHSWRRQTYPDCVSSPTTLVDAATGAFRSLSVTVESAEQVNRGEI